MTHTASVAAVAPVTRELPPAEWARLLGYEPFASGGLPPSDQWRILVCEVAGEIVGFTCVFAGAHWEPWFVEPAYQRHPGVIRGLIRGGRDLLLANGIGAAFVVVGDDQPELQAQVERMGFVPAPGRLYTIAPEKVEA